MVVNDVIYFINGIFAAGCSIESLCPDEVFFMSMTIYELGFVSVTRGQLCFACIYFWVLSSLAIPMTDKMGWSICKDPYFKLSVIYQFITFNQRLLLKKTNTFLKRILSFFVEIGLQIQSKLSNLSLNRILLLPLGDLPLQILTQLRLLGLWEEMKVFGLTPVRCYKWLWCESAPPPTCAVPNLQFLSSHCPHKL